MTVVNNENTPQTNLETEKIVETNMDQQKVDPNLQQQTNEVKNQEIVEDPNWRAFREARKKDRAEKEAAQKLAMEKEAEAQALRAAMEAAFSKQNPVINQQQYNNSDFEEDQESIDVQIEKKVQAAIAKKEAEYERQRQEREIAEYPQRLVKTYSDFNQTISQENLDYLDFHYPEVSRPLQRLQDNFEKWEDVYKAVKKFVPNSQGVKKDTLKAEQNFMKPRSMSSTGMTQSQENSNAKLTEDRKSANWERMQKVMKSIG